MTPTELMNSCLDSDKDAKAFRNDFWAITQEELERFYKAAQAAALRDAADKMEAMGYVDSVADLLRMAEELEK